MTAHTGINRLNMSKIGTGSIEAPCEACDGKGEVLLPLRNSYRAELTDCKECKGTGVIVHDDPHNYDDVAVF